MSSAPDHPAVEAFELLLVRVPMVAPLRAAHAGDGVEEDPEREVVLVKAAGADGVEGWGECSTLSRPTYNPEHTRGAWALLRDQIAPTLLAGGDLDVRGNHMALSSVEAALADLRARRSGWSLARQLGGGRTRVPSCAVVGLETSVEATCAQVERAVERGHGQVKLKVRPGWSVEPLEAVRERWPDLPVAADANASFDPSPWGPARSELEAVDELGLTYFEQPFAPDDLVASAGLAAGWHTPVALDESITSLGTLASALSLGSLQVLNLKAGRVGGLAAAVRIAQAAADGGVEVFVGGMLETGVGRAAALGLASLEACSLPTDLGPSDRYFPADITEPFDLTDGCLEVPSGVGIGVTPLPERLEAFAVERAWVSR